MIEQQSGDRILKREEKMFTGETFIYEASSKVHEWGQCCDRVA